MESIWPPSPPSSLVAGQATRFLIFCIIVRQHRRAPTTVLSSPSFPSRFIPANSRDPSRPEGKDRVSYPNSLSRPLPSLSRSLFRSLAWQKVAWKGRNETREIFPFLSRDESEIEYHLAYLEMLFARSRHLIFTNGESKRGCIDIYI